MTEQWEVEQKYFVGDTQQLLGRLDDLGAKETQLERHNDTYLVHPARDFRKSDEAFRVRCVDDWACVTYKGPRIPGAVKTRPEIELKIDSGEVSQWLRMFELLGFRTLPCVEKTRRVYQLDYFGRQFTLAIDSVNLLGEFAEIELLVTNEHDLPAARQSIQSLGDVLGLNQPQPKSYLSQLLAKLGHELA